MAENQAPTIPRQRGTIFPHGENDKVRVPEDTDLLIQGDNITKIGKDFVFGPYTKEINCHEKVISRGFVNTHHHVW
ncbi:uncharacterized protein A1O5_08230 [Cladophialophora psammophila CBS 110553]|uniref:Uncharacterized protein n=1 Tax=Cladophialophora psammophila CBS 110553 TaxID=1182543 RepID=W9WKK9_9EURO|nr:uncharacterized protein A1O5_08230 [Cladophialophora psammophila CBS 110553]EXJ68438.1 hypothetical protein A1O5_08230 [Cladophialophora psammophila CBS 110553]